MRQIRSSPIHHPHPPATPRPRQPGRIGLLGELRAVGTIGRLVASSPRLRRAPRGDGAPVVLLPGWLTSDNSMAPLASYLRWLGHDARGWGLGVNRGRPEYDRKRLAPRIADIVRATGRPVTLVGWSLGGLIARESARFIPEHIAQVITYGTPIQGPRYTIGARNWSPDQAAQIERIAAERERKSPISVPITIIFSRRDRIVSWPVCIDRHSPKAHHIEVGSSHLGMGMDPDVWSIVARRLSADAPGGRFDA